MTGTVIVDEAKRVVEGATRLLRHKALQMTLHQAEKSDATANPELWASCHDESNTFKHLGRNLASNLQMHSAVLQ